MAIVKRRDQNMGRAFNYLGSAGQLDSVRTQSVYDKRQFTDEDMSQVVYYVRTRLVLHTVDLVQKTRVAVSDTDDFRSPAKIQPVTDGSSMYSLVRSLGSIFLSICTVRDKSAITASLFEKLLHRTVSKR